MRYPLHLPANNGIPLVAARMQDLAARIDEVLSEFRSWGIRISEFGRLVKARDVLRSVGKTGHYPSDRAQLTEIAYAARDIQEFTEIADVLPTDQLRPLATALQTAVGGTLIPAGGSASKALQHQTQLWVGAALTHAGASVAVLTNPKGPNPDFVIEKGTYRYAVEVKRPSSFDPENIISEAAGQIGAGKYHGGAIAVDVTDCLDAGLRVRFGSGDLDHHTTKDQFLSFANLLHAEIYNEGSHQMRPRRVHVFTLFVVARMVYWDEDTLREPHIGRTVASVAYKGRYPGTLRAHRATWLATLVHKGITAVGHQQLDFGEFIF